MLWHAGLTGNTLDSHRLIEWALHQGGPDAQNALVEELFRNYFTEVRGWVGLCGKMSTKVVSWVCVPVRRRGWAGITGVT
jgi:hypothetical protein